MNEGINGSNSGTSYDSVLISIYFALASSILIKSNCCGFVVELIDESKCSLHCDM